MKKTFRFPALALGMLLTVAGAAPLASAAPPQNVPLTSTTVSVPARQLWVDSGILLYPGASYTVTATGLSSCNNAVNTVTGQPCTSDPNGDNPVTGQSWDLNTNVHYCGPWAAPGLQAWSLVGRIGQSGAPFFVGSGPTEFTGSGELYLTFNDTTLCYGDNSGGFTATVTTVLTNLSACTDGAWQNWGVFKNQGDCVSFMATKGKNAPGFDGKGN